jgi:hypothetical protein
MSEISKTRDPEGDRRRDLLFAVSKKAIVTKWTTEDGHLKKHVSAVLWLLARIMVQDTWGVDDLEGSLYELLDPTAELELDIGNDAPATEEEVRLREVDFLRAGESMHRFWERATRDYVQRYREPLSLEGRVAPVRPRNEKCPNTGISIPQPVRRVGMERAW